MRSDRGKDVNISFSDDELELNSLPFDGKSRLSIHNEEPEDGQHHNNNNDDSILMKCERSKSLDPTQNISFAAVQRRISSMISLGEFGGALNIEESSKLGMWYVPNVMFALIGNGRCNYQNNF